MAGRVGRPQCDGERAGLGGPVHVAQRHAARQKSLHQRDGQRAGAGPDRAQARQVGRCPARVFDQPFHRRRHVQGECRSLAPDGIQRRTRVEAGVQQHRGPGVQRRQRLDAQATDMEQRQHREHPVLAGQRLDLRGRSHVGQQVGLRVHRALRQTGGARGVDQQRRALRCGVDRGIARCRGGDQRVDGVRRQASSLRQRLGGIGPGGVVQQGNRRAVGQHRMPFGACEAKVQRHQHRADARQREQQCELVRVVQPQPRDPVAGAHPPFVPQPGAGALEAAGELAVGEGAALEP